MDKLEQMFDLQSQLDENIVKIKNLKDIPFEEWMQKDCIAMISELSELMDEVNFKWWKNPKPLDMSRIHEELVDILHFFISMCIKANLSPEELFTGYVNKNQENFDRQSGKSKKQGY